MDAIFTLALALNDTLPVDFNVTDLTRTEFIGASVRQ